MEITDDKLLKIALVTSLIGLIGLIIFTPTIEVKKVKIELEFEVAMKDDAATVNMSNEEMADWFGEWLAEQYKEIDNIDNIKIKTAIADKE